MASDPTGWSRNDDGTASPPAIASPQNWYNVPENVQRTIIKDGALLIFNAAGLEVVRLGKQTDNTYGLRVADSSTGSTFVGSDGISVRNAAGTQVLFIGRQSTGRYGLSSFDGSGNRIIDLGELASSLQGMEVFNTSAVRQVRLGQLASGYGLEALDASGNTVTLDKLAFQVQFAQVITAESTTSTTATDLATDGPSVTVTVGSSGRALVYAGAGVGLDATGATAVVQLNRDSGAETVNFVTFVHNLGGSGTVSEARGRLFTGLSAGSHTFKLRYFTTANTATFSARWIAAQPY